MNKIYTVSSSLHSKSSFQSVRNFNWVMSFPLNMNKEKNFDRLTYYTEKTFYICFFFLDNFPYFICVKYLQENPNIHKTYEGFFYAIPTNFFFLPSVFIIMFVYLLHSFKVFGLFSKIFQNIQQAFNSFKYFII